MIACAAVKLHINPLDKDIILPLHWHRHWVPICNAFGYDASEITVVKEGFLTYHGDFLDRYDAADEAYRCNQTFDNQGMLFTDNLGW